MISTPYLPLNKTLHQHQNPSPTHNPKTHIPFLCISSFLYCCDKIAWQNLLKEKTADINLQSSMARRWQVVAEVWGSLSVRKQSVGPAYKTWKHSPATCFLQPSSIIFPDSATLWNQVFKPDVMGTFYIQTTAFIAFPFVFHAHAKDLTIVFWISVSQPYCSPFLPIGLGSSLGTFLPIWGSFFKNYFRPDQPYKFFWPFIY